MAWEIVSLLGTIAFAISGAMVAMEEKYDILGIYVLGMVTAFGGGALRNILVGIPVSKLWEQGFFFLIAMVTITIVYVFPGKMVSQWGLWGNFLDAVGLAAFAIQGALFTMDLNLSIGATIVAAVLTGSGGGLIRDVLAGRKPIMLRDEIYALWGMLAGLIVGMGIADTSMKLFLLFVFILVMRVFSYKLQWKLPIKDLSESIKKES